MSKKISRLPQIFCCATCLLLQTFAGSLFAQAKQPAPAMIPDAMQPVDVSSIRLGGHLGSRIDACGLHRVKKQDVHHLTAPFFHRTETRLWQSEFWGKWTLGAVSYYRYTNDSELLDSIESGLSDILRSQLPNGYIGNYSEAAQLQQWDIWGRKYTLLGLLACYDLTGNRHILDACRRLADHLLSQVGPGKTNIVATGNYRGMPGSSILEPVVYLYRHTGEQRYLDFAQYIVSQWETPQGPRLISLAKAGVDVAERFPHPGSEENWTDNGGKAYEMMSCYEGLLELYKITGHAEYLSVVEKTVRNIMDTEINIAGSGSAHECWYHGRQHQTRPTYHTMETCVTMTWMQLCMRLLSLTGNPLYADRIEQSACNALPASLKDDATQTAMYSPLTGQHFYSSGQCGMRINCCSANAPRAFAMLPQFAVMQSAGKDKDKGKNSDIFINLYTDLSVTLSLNKKQSIRITQQTAYPEDGLVRIRIDTDRPATFALSLRIPAWSAISTVQLNGEKTSAATPGAYYRIDRTWKKGDEILLTLDVRTRIVKKHGHAALLKGPVALARDSRFADGWIDEEGLIIADGGFVELFPVVPRPAGMWMAFSVPMKVGTFPAGISRVHFCDFGSAGNSWTRNDRHRVWIPEIWDTTQPNE
jgi:DUF1680 family protein